MFLKSWTDYPKEEAENPYAGKIDFWYDDLQMLSRLIMEIKKV